MSPGPAKPVVDVGLSDGPCVQAYTASKTSVAVEGRCVEGTMEGQPWGAKLTPTIKDEAIAELARRYGGGASEPITLIGGGGLQPQEEGGAQG